jgi:hypothetical protein
MIFKTHFDFLYQVKSPACPAQKEIVERLTVSLRNVFIVNQLTEFPHLSARSSIAQNYVQVYWW